MALNSHRRNRGSSEDSICCSPPASPASTPSILSLQEARLREREDLGSYSPRAVVAGRLGELAIRGDCAATHQIPNSSLHQLPHLQSTPTSCLPTFSNDIHDLHDMPEPHPPSTTLESETKPLNTTAPSESTANDAAQPQNLNSPTKSARKQLSSSPRKKRNAAASLKTRNARVSPPLAGAAVENPFTWSDAEITGHNPTDPSDDGYGINGIGFKPTAAMAWARSQRRQKQVTEWKVREAREAREKRREKRDGNEFDKIRTIQNGAIQKRVKFDV